MKELDSNGFVDRLYKSPAVVKAPPRVETVSVPALKEKPAAVEAKVKLSGTDEKANASAKQVTAISDKKPSQDVQSKTAATQPQYVVKSGDTLSKLAERLYNSVGKWEKIYEANRDTLKNPNYIFIGQKLIIPPDDQAG
jgi:nucleoid-associated protein YgaU